MEFTAQGEIYEDSLAIQPEAPTKWLHNEDDLYVNMHQAYRASLLQPPCR